MRGALIALALCASLAPYANHFVIPLLPEIQTALGVSYASAQLTVSVFLVALACGQLLMGVLTDRFGSFRVLAVGMGLFAASSLAAAFSSGLGSVVALRFVQGVSVSSGMVVALTAIGSSHGARLATNTAYLLTWLSVVSMFAPLAGGFIGGRFGWQAAFAAAGGAGALCLFLPFAVQQSGVLRKPGPSDGPPVGPSASFARLARNRVFVASATIIAMAIGAYYFALAALPFVARYMFGLSPVRTGAWFLVLGGGLPVGSLAAGWLAPRIGLATTIRFGSALMVLSAFMPLVFWMLDLFGPASLFGPMTLLAGATTLVLSGTQAAAVASSPGQTGTAVGTSGALQFGASAVFSILGGWAIEVSGQPFACLLVTVLLCTIVLALSFLWRAQSE